MTAPTTKAFFDLWRDFERTPNAAPPAVNQERASEGLGYDSGRAHPLAALEPRMQVVCLDLEGVLVPEIWIA
ncbi:MAG: hypothetical protein ACOVN7_01355, partial [Rubrivivax sp.]